MNLKMWQNNMEIAGVNEVVGIIRRALNFVDPRLMEHGSRVSAVVLQMLRAQGKYSEKDIRDICLIALLHDIGAYKTEEIDRMVQFETGDVFDHSIYGYLFIKYFSPLSRWAEVVLYHHTDWSELKELGTVSSDQKELAQMVNLADRLDIYLEQTNGTVKEFLDRLQAGRRDRYSQEVLALLQKADSNDSFVEAKMEVEEESILDSVKMAAEERDAYLRMIVFAIDFRSYYTVTHTIVTTGISQEIAKRLGMSEEEEQKIVSGALIHDLGKIAIPVEILEYPGALSPEKMEIMRTHVDLTDEILGRDVEEPIRRIALYHHEKLDGSGYPRELRGDEINLSERIVAVADIVSALNGKRSYKDVFPREQTIRILENMSGRGLLDERVVALVVEQFDEIMAVVTRICEPIINIYNQISIEYEQMRGRHAN